MTAFKPTSVPPPGRLSTMTGCWTRKPRAGATTLAKISLGDPAVYGTMILIGLSGYEDWARLEPLTTPANPPIAAAHTRDRLVTAAFIALVLAARQRGSLARPC